MKSKVRWQNALAITLPAWAIFFTLTCPGLFSSYAETQEKKIEDFDITSFSNSTQNDNRLARLVHLNATAMAEVRTEVLKPDNPAYEDSKNVYARTPAPAHASGTSLKICKPAILAQAAVKAAKITEDEAVEIALKAVPGEVTDVAIEKKLGANRWVVEVLAKEDGRETDVIIDMETGKVLATEH